jgi:hypothetical protein
MISSGLVGSIIARLLFPPKTPSDNVTFIAKDVTITQVNHYVQQQIYQPTPGRVQSAAPDSGAQLQMFFFAVAALSIGVLVAMVAYGTLVVAMVRLLVATTGVAAAILGTRIIFSPTAFQPFSWIIRVFLIVFICVLLWFSLNYIEDGITTSIISALRQGYAINNLRDIIELFGLEGSKRLWYFAITLIIAVAVALFALTAQLHMLLSAHAATAFDPHDWRVRLLGWMGNRSSFVVFVGMVMLSLMAFAIASGQSQRLIKMLFP